MTTEPNSKATGRAKNAVQSSGTRKLARASNATAHARRLGENAKGHRVNSKHRGPLPKKEIVSPFTAIRRALDKRDNYLREVGGFYPDRVLDRNRPGAQKE